MKREGWRKKKKNRVEISFQDTSWKLGTKALYAIVQRGNSKFRVNSRHVSLVFEGQILFLIKESRLYDTQRFHRAFEEERNEERKIERKRGGNPTGIASGRTREGLLSFTKLKRYLYRQSA